MYEDINKCTKTKTKKFVISKLMNILSCTCTLRKFEMFTLPTKELLDIYLQFILPHEFTKINDIECNVRYIKHNKRQNI